MNREMDDADAKKDLGVFLKHFQLKKREFCETPNAGTVVRFGSHESFNPELHQIKETNMHIVLYCCSCSLTHLPNVKKSNSFMA